MSFRVTALRVSAGAVGAQVVGQGVAENIARGPPFGGRERVELLIRRGRQPDLPDLGMFPRPGGRIDTRPAP